MKTLAAVLLLITGFVSAVGYLSLQRPVPKPSKWIAIVRGGERDNSKLLVESKGWVVTQSGMDTCVVFTNEGENVALVCGAIAVGKAEP